MNVLIVMVLVPAAVVVYSFVWTGGGSRYDLCFYEKDKFHQSGEVVRRRYQGLGHFLYRLGDLLRYAWPLLRVYVLRTIAPGFREKIMITTALANNCRH
jgi:hypothetical protein